MTTADTTEPIGAQAHAAATAMPLLDQRFSLWELDVLIHLKTTYDVEGCWNNGMVTVRWHQANRLFDVANGMDGTAQFLGTILECDVFWDAIPVLIRAVKP